MNFGVLAGFLNWKVTTRRSIVRGNSNSRGKDGTHVNNLKCTAPMLVILKRRNIALRNFGSGVVEIEVDDRFLCMGPHRRRGCLTTEVFHSLASLIPAASEEGL